MRTILYILINVLFIVVFFLFLTPLKFLFKVVGYDPLRLDFGKYKNLSFFRRINGKARIKRALLISGTKNTGISICEHPDTIYPLS